MATSLREKAENTDVDVNELVEKIVDYCEKQSGIDLYPYQREFASSIVESFIFNDGREITCLMARQIGKTETVSVVIGGLLVIVPKLAGMDKFKDFLGLYEDGIRIGLFAPSKEQGHTTFSRTLERLTSDSAVEVLTDPEIDTKITKESNPIKLDNGSLLRLQSAAKQAKIESKTYDLLIIEEAQDINRRKLLKCLTKDTRVMTEDGYKRIEDIVKDKNDKILHFNEDFSEKKFSMPTDWYINGVQPVYEIELAGGKNIKATSNHQFLARSKKGNRNFDWHTVEEIMEEDHLAQMGVPDKVEVFNDECDLDYTDGLLAGYMLGDDGVYNVGMSTEGTKKGANPVTKKLKEIGIWGLKSGEKKLPEEKVYSKEFYKGLIEGLIETDGSIENYERKPIISFSNISEDLIEQIEDILIKFGIHPTKFCRKNDTELTKEDENQSLHFLHIKRVHDLRKFYEEFDLFTKQILLDKAVETIKDKKGKTRTKDVKGYPNTMRFYQIKNIKFIGYDQTYCLEMPDRNFIADNIISSNSIHPTGASTNATIVKIGTAIDQKCEFYDTIQRNKRKDARESGDNRHHFEYDYKTGMKYNPRYKEYVEKEKERYGENSDEFRMSYRLEWLLERGMFVTPQMMEDMTDNTVKHKNSDAGYCVAGIDLGKRQASTVVTIGRVEWDEAEEEELTGELNPPITILNWLEIEGDDYESQHHEMMSFMSNYNLECIYVDSTGVGTSIADRLTHEYEGIAHVEMYDFTVPSKSDMWKKLRKEIRMGRITVPSHSHTMRLRARQRWQVQMENLVKEWKGQYLRAHAPKDDKKARDDYCFTGNTPVITLDNVKDIKNVETGDLVRTHKGRWRKVKKLYRRNTEDDLIKISNYYFGDSTMTKNHPVLTEDGYKNAEEITVGDKIKYAINTKEESPDDFDMKKYFEKAKDDSTHWTTDIEKKDEKIKYRNPKAKWHNEIVKSNGELFKLLGYYMSEGSCGAHNVQFTIFNENEEIIEEIQKLLKEVFGIAEDGIGITKNERNNTVNVYTSSIAIKEFIKDIIPGTAGEKIIPQFIVNAEKDLQKEFIRGFFNGDGHVCENGKEIGFTTTSRTLAIQLRDMLLRFNIVTSLHIHERAGKKGEIRGREINHNYNLHTLRINHTKYSNKLKNLVKKGEEKEESKFHPPRAKFEDGYVLLEVRKVENIKNDSCTVYNLEVEDDNSYTVLNGTVHNCDSMGLMVLAGHADAMPEIETANNPFFERTR